MPFCTHCGTSVGTGAAYCTRCGTPQPRTTIPAVNLVEGISERTALILCYIPVLGVIPAIVFLASQRFRSNVKVRFNGFQALYLFVAWLIVSSAAPTILLGVSGWGAERALLGALKLVIFLCWIYLLIKAAREEQARLPIIGDLAARSATEQL